MLKNHLMPFLSNIFHGAKVNVQNLLRWEFMILTKEDKSMNYIDLNGF